MAAKLERLQEEIKAEQAKNADYKFVIEAQQPGSVANARTSADSHKFRIQKLEFKKAKLVDVMRTISEISDINIVPTREAGEKEVTVYLRNVSVHEAIDTIKNGGEESTSNKVDDAVDEAREGAEDTADELKN